MNNSKVKVKIITVQIIDEAGNEDVIDFLTEANIDYRDDAFILDYNENDITENEKTKTRIKIYKNKLLMTKLGSYSSKMIFEKNNPYTTMYTTPYGTFDLFLDTLKYENSLNSLGKGKIYVEYRILFGNSGENLNKMKIEIL